MESLEQKLFRYLKEENYREYNKLIVELYAVDPLIYGPERLGGQRVISVPSDWFEYNESEEDICQI